jgi:hypothetical protein
MQISSSVSNYSIDYQWSILVLFVIIMYGEYLMLVWIPHRYPNKILGTWTSHLCMLVEKTTTRPCFNILIIFSTIPLQLAIVEQWINV